MLLIAIVLTLTDEVDSMGKDSPSFIVVPDHLGP